MRAVFYQNAVLLQKSKFGPKLKSQYNISEETVTKPIRKKSIHEKY